MDALFLFCASLLLLYKKKPVNDLYKNYACAIYNHDNNKYYCFIIMYFIGLLHTSKSLLSIYKPDTVTMSFSKIINVGASHQHVIIILN